VYLSLSTTCAVLFAVCLATGAEAQPPQGATPSSDLDAFMEKALKRREVNRETLDLYVLDESETFEILGPGRMRLHRSYRDYTWYVRDGMHVRSPVRFNGVSVGTDDRDRYEENWIRRERSRRERKAKGEKESKQVTVGSEGISTNVVPTEPRFVSEAYFMDFKFEPGNYYLAGREQIEGKDVVKIEYYPERLFADDDKKAPREIRKETRGARKERELEEDIERRMNKTALVTLWVDPVEHQIVKYTFDNVWLDFLPGAWLVRVDDIRASMTMGQPFPGVWLPREMNIHAGISLANGSYEAGYARKFSQYRKAEVATKIRIPKSPEPPPIDEPMPEPETGHGPFVIDEEPQAPGEVLREVRIHGNAFLTDEDVLRVAGLSIGDAIGADTLALVEQRLKDSGRFETIEVRKRYRSLSDPTDVAIVLVVHERPGVTSANPDAPTLARPIHRLKSRLMFLPILSYSDGYGFTYGARFSTMDMLGIGERLSVPLTWGGTRRAALEFDRTFRRGPLTRVLSSASIWQRENPHYDIDDRRLELAARAEKQFASMVRLGAGVTRSAVEFGDLDDDLWTLGADAALDTRGDPNFPGNAVYFGAGWSGLHVKGFERVNRYSLDGRGYLRIFGQPVLAARAQYFNADAALPPYERYLLGGADTLRGHRAGTFSADKMLVTSAELRVPLTSVISGAKLGMTVFMDAAKAVNYGQRLEDAAWQRGAGAGLFLIASFVKINMDVAKGLDGGDVRFHLGSGFSF
jgi:hypothetical protein